MKREDFTEKQVARFWAKVDKTHSCWMWTGKRTSLGYGRPRFGERDLLAHRVAYALENGDLEEALVVDHKCHSPACVRPDHLQAVTYKLNSENRAGAMKNSKTGVRGVWWSTREQKYVACVQSGGRKVYFRRFDSMAAAEAAITAARQRLFTNSLMDHPA